jgi:phage/plasmid-like protein (TIGR03299 family)
MHNLEMVNGQASMVYNARWGNPWHNLGTAVDGAMVASEALEKSHQGFIVEKVQLEYQGQLVDVWGIRRMDNGVVLSPCGKDYQPIQNLEQFECIDVLLANSDGAHYDTAGVLGRGERVWALARIPSADITVNGDQHEAFLLATTSHDGSLAFTLKLVHIRVVCNNTLTSALHANGALARIKHTKSAIARLEMAKNYLHQLKADALNLEERLNVLANRRMTRDSYQSVMDKLFPFTRDSKGNITNQVRHDNILGEIIRLYESNDKDANPAIRGTAYNLLNAVTEWTDHCRSARMSSNREEAGYTQAMANSESALFGNGETLKQKALEVIMMDTKGNPVVQTMHIPSVTAPDVPTSTGSALLDSVIDTNHSS